MIDGAKARRYRTIPIAFLADRELLVATADPANLLALDDIAMATGFEVRRAVASPEDIDALIENIGTLESAVHEIDDEEVAGAGDRAARVGRRRAGREARARGDRGRGAPRGVRHPLRALSERNARALPRGRRGLRLDHRAAPPRLGTRVPDQDHGRARHRREAHAAGRPHRAVGGRQLRRPARGDASGGARRVGRDAHPGLAPGGHEPRQPRPGRRGPCPLPGGDPGHPRRHPRDRPDRFRQDHDALRRPGGAQHARPHDRDRRGPGGVRARGRQADPGEPEDRPDLRHRPARDGARRPGRDHGGRDPRLRRRRRSRSSRRSRGTW